MRNESEIYNIQNGALKPSGTVEKVPRVYTVPLVLLEASLVCKRTRYMWGTEGIHFFYKKSTKSTISFTTTCTLYLSFVPFLATGYVLIIKLLPSDIFGSLQNGVCTR